MSFHKIPIIFSQINLFKNVTKWRKIECRSFPANLTTCAMEDRYGKLLRSDSKSLLKKHLTECVFEELKERKTPSFKATLLDCIQSGLKHHDSKIGVFAPDAEAYQTFGALFDPVIEGCHSCFPKTAKHPAVEFGRSDTICNLDPNCEYIIRTRAECARSVKGYPFTPCLLRCQFKELESLIGSAVTDGELRGKFYSLADTDRSFRRRLYKGNYLFKPTNRFLSAANVYRFWPTGRALFANKERTFLVWCNEQDHVRVIATEKGGDLGSVYRRLARGVLALAAKLSFYHDERLGYLTCSPLDLGTTIRATIQINLPLMAERDFAGVAKKFNLHVRRAGGVYYISNKRRLGLTEIDCMTELQNGIFEIIKLQKGKEEELRLSRL